MSALIAALVLGLLLGALGERAAAEEVIESFVSRVDVARDGTLTVEETIRVRAEGGQIRRGIFRDFPLTFEGPEGDVRQVGFKLLGVTRDGRPEPHFTRRQGESILIYAGEEGVFLQPGTYTYVITYETDRQLRWFDARPVLYWNVTGNAWAFPIQSAVVRVTLPDEAEPVRWTAYTGRVGDRGTDFTGTIADGALVVRATRVLAPGEGISVVAEIPAVAVSEPSAAARTRYFLRGGTGAPRRR